MNRMARKQNKRKIEQTRKRKEQEAQERKLFPIYSSNKREAHTLTAAKMMAVTFNLKGN